MQLRRFVVAAVAPLVLATVPAWADPTSAAVPSPSIGATGSYASCPAPTNNGVMQCMSLVRPEPNKPKGVQADAAPSGYSPADLRSAYNLPATTAGQTVAIVDAYHAPNAEADLAVYRQQYGLPPCTTANGCFTQVDQRGGTQWAAEDQGWGGEISLDLEMVSAVCPNCRLLLVEADTARAADLYAAEDEAIALGAKFVSNSWGGDETPDETQADAHFDHPGVVIAAATGDQGFPGGYPAASPYVLAVGGTSLTRDPSTSRGWSESAWRLAGSGCSSWERAPSFQTQAMTDCSGRATADVSAVADPATGVAVYYGGWQVFGGTSVATPIITAMYALAGTPLTGSRPNTLPYQHADALNDVTSGGGNWCSFKFCIPGSGWDGPTGLGTPNGLGAFNPGPHGEVAGTVSDQATHQPVAGATVGAGGQHVTTGPHGEYSLTLPPGQYTLTVDMFGYAQSATPVELSDGQERTVNVRLVARPRATVSGVVRDGSGQGWPVYASVQVHGQPSTRTFTDPATGRYQLSLPRNDSYSLDVTPAYAGYAPLTQTVAVGDAAVQADISDPVQFASCTAALGYAYQSAPAYTQSFDGTSAPDGWTTVNAFNRALLWRFDDPGGRGNLTGGSGGFAIVDSDYANLIPFQDTSLVSPTWDLSGMAHPTLSFRTDYFGMSNSRATVELSTDGGATWTQLWIHQTDSVRGPSLQTIDLTPWAGQPSVQVRFRYQGYNTWWWQVDDVTLADRSCAPRPGGLVVGEVTDKNTGSGLTGATVTGGPISATTVGTPDDPALPEGLYWAFAAPGHYQLSASQPGGYQVATDSVAVADRAVTAADFALPAGRIAVTPSDIAAHLTLGASTTKTLTISNTGTAPVHLALHDVPGGATPMSVGAGAPTEQVSGKFEAGPAARTITGLTARNAITPQAAPWTTVADYPIPVVDNAMTADDGGSLYSAGGYSTNGTILSRAYRYDPDAAAWTRLPDMSLARDYPVAAYLDGKFYVAGGFDSNTEVTDSVEIYDPATGSWSDGPRMPTPVAAGAVGVLNNRMYVVGGCVGANDCGTDAVQVFDPVTSSWHTVASYPRPVDLEGCGAIGARLYCAGGTSDQFGPSRDGWTYDPGTNHWTQIAGMPYGSQFGAAYSAADGRLLMVGGVIADGGLLTNQGWAYDPSNNSWSSLPNANTVAWRAAGACGFYKVGGAALVPALVNAEMLPGYGDCASAANVSWLAATPAGPTVLRPGASITVQVTLSAAELSQPGVYQAGLTASDDTPYPYRTLPITLTVDPPKGWGRLAGAVTGTTCTGATVRLAGATVSVAGQQQTYTLHAGTDGGYQLWLDAHDGPVDVTAAKDGWVPTGQTGVKLSGGKTTTVGLNLLPNPAC